jgi:hypothetical protein
MQKRPTRTLAVLVGPEAFQDKPAATVKNQHLLAKLFQHSAARKSVANPKQ